MADAPSDKLEMTAAPAREEKAIAEHETLKYSLLGPSLTKSGQDNVDQNKAGLQSLATGPNN
jgi:hypothetical protein